MDEKVQDAKKEEFQLPDPVLPKLEMPEPPVVDGGLKNAPHISCDGEVYRDPNKKDNSGIPEPLPGVPKILIGIPVLTFNHEFVLSFLKFWTDICTQAKGKMQIGYSFMYRKPVHMAEILLAEMAVYNKCTHLLLMDDDIFDVTLDDLKKLLDADKDVIGGVMYTQKFPYAMCVFRRFDSNKKVIDMPSDNTMCRLYEVPCTCKTCGTPQSHWDGKFCIACGSPTDNLIQEADLIPFAFTLIKTSVFPKLKKPWFHCEIEYPTDSWFADRCLEAGIREYAHMGVRLNHNGVTDLSKPFLFQADMAKKQQTGQGLVGLSEEDMNKHQFILNLKMKEAEDKLKAKPDMITVGETEEEKNDSKTKSVPDGVPEKACVEVPG